MADDQNKPKIGPADNWLGDIRPRYFTKYTVAAIPLLIWEASKLSLWLLFALSIIYLIHQLLDLPMPHVTDVWSGVAYLILTWTIKDFCQLLCSWFRKRK